MMPINFVLVRHGESEGNVANRRSRRGDNRHFTEGFRKRPSSQWRLTTRGEWQVRESGLWIRKNIMTRFDRRTTSSHIRAMGSAYQLEVLGPPWHVDYNLRERDYGQLDLLTDEERRDQFASDMERKETDPFLWAPGGGESMASVALRLRAPISTLHRECSDMNVIWVCHGEVMWTVRILLERMTPWRYLELHASKDPHHRINNAQVIHYTRRDPVTGEPSHKLEWVRSVCPWDIERSNNEWQRIHRPTFTDQELREEIESAPYSSRVFFYKRFALGQGFFYRTT